MGALSIGFKFPVEMAEMNMLELPSKTNSKKNDLSAEGKLGK